MISEDKIYHLLCDLEGLQVNAFPRRVVLPNVGLKSPVNKQFVTRGTPIVDGPHMLRLQVSFHLCLFFTSLATDQAYKAHVTHSSLELHQRIDIIILGHI